MDYKLNDTIVGKVLLINAIEKYYFASTYENNKHNFYVHS